MGKLKSLHSRKMASSPPATHPGIGDGAGALILASEEAVKKHGLKPLARLVQWSRRWRRAPEIMGIGPVPAIRGALDRAGLGLGDMDLIEINEAFAPQYLACEKELELDREQGQRQRRRDLQSATRSAPPAPGSPPTSCTSCIRRKGKYAVGSACIGGGQGIALVLENELMSLRIR